MQCKACCRCIQRRRCCAPRCQHHPIFENAGVTHHPKGQRRGHTRRHRRVQGKADMHFLVHIFRCDCASSTPPTSILADQPRHPTHLHVICHHRHQPSRLGHTGHRRDCSSECHVALLQSPNVTICACACPTSRFVHGYQSCSRCSRASGKCALFWPCHLCASVTLPTSKHVTFLIFLKLPPSAPPLCLGQATNSCLTAT